MVNTKRIGYIDAAKGIGILMIMFGHMNTLSNPVASFMSTFKITIFYLITGFLVYLKSGYNIDLCKEDYVNIIKKKALALGFPYLFFSVLAIVLNVFFYIVTKQNTIARTLDDVYSIVSLRGISTLWFLPTLFLGELILYLHISKSVSHKTYYIEMISLPIVMVLTEFLYHSFLENSNLAHWTEILICYPLLTIIKSISAYWFIIVGYLLFPKIKDKINIISIIVGLVIVIFISCINTNVDFNMFSLGRFGVCFFIAGALGSIISICFLEKLYENEASTKLLSSLEYIGRNSLFLMATHLPLYISTVILYVFNKIFETGTLSYIYYMRWIVMCMILLTVELIGLFIWQQIKESEFMQKSKFGRLLVKYL